MNKKGILLSVLGIILVSSLLLVIINNNTKKTFIQDGVLFAVTLDGVSQSSFPNGNNYYADINCVNVRGRWMRVPNTDGGSDYTFKFILDEFKGTDNASCNVDFTTINTSDVSDAHNLKNVVKFNATNETSDTVTNNTSNVELNAGYRYEGTNPNNYIWFNNEMWRIIGVVPACKSANCTEKEDLVKIIRAEVLGNVAYDAKSSDYTGVWGSNTLYTLLNTYYWGKQDGTNTAYCYGYQTFGKTKCDYRVKGISSNDYYGNMVEEVIWNTGSSTNEANVKTVYGSEVQTQSVKGYIGLMNASDYGYGSSESTRGNLNNYGNAAISLANWLYTNNYVWTITQYTNTSFALRVSSNGNVYADYAYIGYADRPTLYLKSNVYVVSGDGSESTPYQIAITN